MIRAFVSSTSLELKAHRASVIARLPAARLFVAAMEQRTAIVAAADVSRRTLSGRKANRRGRPFCGCGSFAPCSGLPERQFDAAVRRSCCGNHPPARQRQEVVFQRTSLASVEHDPAHEVLVLLERGAQGPDVGGVGTGHPACAGLAGLDVQRAPNTVLSEPQFDAAALVRPAESLRGFCAPQPGPGVSLMGLNPGNPWNRPKSLSAVCRPPPWSIARTAKAEMESAGSAHSMPGGSSRRRGRSRCPCMAGRSTNSSASTS